MVDLCWVGKHLPAPIGEVWCDNVAPGRARSEAPVSTGPFFFGSDRTRRLLEQGAESPSHLTQLNRARSQLTSKLRLSARWLRRDQLGVTTRRKTVTFVPGLGMRSVCASQIGAATEA